MDKECPVSFLLRKDGPVGQVWPCDSVPGNCTHSARSLGTRVCFYEKGALPQQYGLENRDREAYVTIKDVWWRRCCEESFEVCEENVVLRCRRYVLYAEDGRVDGCCIRDFEKLRWPVAFSKDIVKKFQASWKLWEHVAAGDCAMGAFLHSLWRRLWKWVRTVRLVIQLSTSWSQTGI